MSYDKSLVAAKLRRWEKFINNYRLPMWESIPDIGLYMEQVLALLGEYVNYLPEEIKSEQFVTAAAINNYVRKRLMPEPVRKKYYRIHIAYLVMICTLKQSLSMSLIQRFLPEGLSEEDLKEKYDNFARLQYASTKSFVDVTRQIAGKILDHADAPEYALDNTEDLIICSIVFGGLSRLLAEKLLLLTDQGEPGEDAGENAEENAAGA